MIARWNNASENRAHRSKRITLSIMQPTNDVMEVRPSGKLGHRTVQWIPATGRSSQPRVFEYPGCLSEGRRSRARLHCSVGTNVWLQIFHREGCYYQASGGVASVVPWSKTGDNMTPCPRPSCDGRGGPESDSGGTSDLWLLAVGGERFLVDVARVGSLVSLGVRWVSWKCVRARHHGVAESRVNSRTSSRQVKDFLMTVRK